MHQDLVVRLVAMTETAESPHSLGSADLRMMADCQKQIQFEKRIIDWAAEIDTAVVVIAAVAEAVLIVVAVGEVVVAVAAVGVVAAARKPPN